MTGPGIASLPMYDWPEVRRETNAFWLVLRDHLLEAGFETPAGLLRSSTDSDAWLDPNLLVSQTCGYPFATRLRGKVTLLGTPQYRVEGCEGATYSSAIVVARGNGAAASEMARAQRFAYNSRDSLSGYRCLVPLVGAPDQYFEQTVASGGHRESARMVADGRADIAAVDAVCWSLFKRFEPDAARRLRVLRWSDKFPALPFITNGFWPQGPLERLRRVLRQGGETRAAENLGIEKIVLIPETAYEPLSQL